MMKVCSWTFPIWQQSTAPALSQVSRIVTHTCGAISRSGFERLGVCLPFGPVLGHGVNLTIYIDLFKSNILIREELCLEPLRWSRAAPLDLGYSAGQFESALA